MDWVESIHRAIRYMEDHLREELTIRDIAQQAVRTMGRFMEQVM